jgi:hypothetical protein
MLMGSPSLPPIAFLIASAALVRSGINPRSFSASAAVRLVGVLAPHIDPTAGEAAKHGEELSFDGVVQLIRVSMLT